MKQTVAGRVVMALACAAMAGSLAVAQGPGTGSGMRQGFGDHRPPFERAFGHEGREMQWWNNPRIADRLKLTDDQRKAMDAIMQDHKVTLVDLHANLEKAELEMEPLMKADQPNESAILSQIDKVAQARAELEKANARFLLALRAKLTPDQWKQVQNFREGGGPERRGWSRDGRHGDGWPPHGQQAPPPPDGQQGAPAPPAPGSGDAQ
ncbi:MAG TPA: Spy/CpxP family protein refolding chaperone [Terracidiphilus sp.]|jgi:Spy/CpxP family protein refolding chaperone|nr:Spy/CpxP family protein refolding chaperone [Terracidiphilus sp.]